MLRGHLICTASQNCQCERFSWAPDLSHWQFIVMSISLTQAREILEDQEITDGELQEILNACEELTDIFIENLIDSKHGSKT